MNNKRKGFTLIELLVVIAIIGILSSVVLASLNSARQKSRDARRVSDIKQLQLALELYFDTAGEYPDALADLAPTHIATVPVPPAGASQAAYDYDNLATSAGTACAIASGSCMYYHLGAVLEDVGHDALDADADKDGTTWTFDGLDANCDTTAGAGADQCYDVTP